MQFVYKTVEEVMPAAVALACKCNTYAEFKKNHTKYYDWARSNGRLNDIKRFLPPGKNPGRRRLPGTRTKTGRRLEVLQKWKNTPKNRIAQSHRERVYTALKGQIKYASSEILLGCSFEELRNHLERQFKPGMSWDNYGEWHVDHIKPCASFDLSKSSEQRICFHYTNLQPLWAVDNLSKNSRFVPV